MRKIFYFILITFVFSCKENPKNNQNNGAIKKEKEISKLPFGNQHITNFNFLNNMWMDDYEDKELQLATNFLYLDNLNLQKIKLNIEIHSVAQKYFMLQGGIIEEMKTKSIYNSLYFLQAENEYKLYYASSEPKKNENERFRNQILGYLVTLDNDNNLIDNIIFNLIAYSSIEYSDRWSFLNTRLSYINDFKEIFIYDFMSKEWDMSYEYKLMEKSKYEISQKGKFIQQEE